MQRRHALAALTAAATWPAALPLPAGASPAPLLAKGDAVRWPAESVALLDGGRFDLKALQAANAAQRQALVLVFWATHCPFCARHNPHVEKLHRAAAGRPLKVLTASSDRDPGTVRRYLQQRGYSFAVTMAQAPLRALFTQRGVIPLTVTIGRDGRLRDVIPGEMFEEDVMDLLPQLTA